MADHPALVSWSVQSDGQSERGTDRIPGDKIPEDKIPEDKIPEDKIPEDKIPEDKISVPVGRISW